MGDLVSPRRRDVYDRLRRRIEQYRRHHQVRLDRVSEPPANNGLYEHQRQETLLLQQRWLESKAKRAAKNSKSSRDPNSQHNNNQLSKLKRKLDSQNNITSEGLPPVGIDHYKFEDQSSPPLKKQCHGGGQQQQHQQHQQQQDQQGKTKSEAQHCVSVNIDLQQISNSQSIETSQTSQIQLTVKSTLHTGGGAQNNATSSSTSASVSTNTICKQEPEHAQASSNQVQQDINNQHSNSNSSQNSIPDSIGFDDVEFDELNDILNQLEKEEGGLPPELLKELDLGRIPVDGQHQDAHPPQSHQVKQDTNNQQHQQDYSKVNSSSANNPLYFAGDSANAASHVHVKKGSPGPGMFADPIYDNSNVSANPNSYGMGGPAGAASMTAYARPPTGHGPAGPSPPLGAAHGEVPPPLPPLGDTGPAAETLKQMAAQHQSQDGYMKVGGAVSYAAEGYHDGYRRQMSYPGGYTSPNYPMSVSVTQQGGAMYPYNHQMAGRAPYMGAPAAAQGNMGMKTEMGTYGATKPLTHFSPGSSPSPSATGSSLQRLQNQVQSHFSQAPSHQGMPAGPSTQMQISQSQQMHMSSQQAGHASMHFSQSQHMQIHTSGASVNGPPPNITMAQQQSFSMGPQYGVTPGAMSQQMYQEKMRQDGGGMQGSAQYMNRPPPTYPQQQAQQSGMATSNPLQTMQNMVNQTSPNVPPNGGQSGPNGGTGEMYAATGIKTEGISRGQQHSMSAGARESPQPGPPGAGGNAVGAAQAGGGYPARPPPQMMAAAQQQQMVNGGVVGRSSTKTEQSTYTSALMRGQRPPNVNVGPDGLNISQQRPPDWPRHMMAGGGGGHPGHMARPPPPQGGGMMQYGGYNNPAAAMQGARMHMAQHQQAMAMQQRGMGGGGGMGGMPPHQGMRAPHPHMQHMMMGQHQQMHMQNGGQQQAMAMGISQTSAMGVTGNSQPPHSVTQQQGGHYPPHSTAQNPPGGAEFSLDFLDSTNGEGPNFFDSNASDFNFIEDILSSK